jgi:1-acyl-sn-glycerol-3-phosphate acyltransferase
MIDTQKVQPIGRRMPRIGRVGVVIGKPLDFSRYEGMANDRFVQRSVTDEIMYELMRISGQEYSDIYAATMKERLAAAKRRPVRVGRDGTVVADGPGTGSTTPGRVARGLDEDAAAAGPGDDGLPDTA